MKVLKFPHPNLFEPTIPVTVFGEELKILLDSMWETMLECNGIGLSANQVGLSFRMFVMQGTQGRINLVNPVVVNQSIQPANLKEGCLSAPGDFVIVPSRVDWVHVKYQNELGQDRFATFGGIHSVAFFHELDHLDGKSFMQNKSIPRPIRNFLKKKWGVK